jgi:transposase InsO family protein
VSQFTNDDFTGTLKRHGVTISMDGNGRYMDNIFVERLLAQPQIRGGLPQRLCQRNVDEGYGRSDAITVAPGAI